MVVAVNTPLGLKIRDISLHMGVKLENRWSVPLQLTQSMLSFSKGN